uniref:Uncharacterized protein n=1 Tax=Grammatophora oceanica TaxID=210454 RepID=A0A7S1Y5V2_9STRA
MVGVNDDGSTRSPFTDPATTHPNPIAVRPIACTMKTVLTLLLTAFLAGFGSAFINPGRQTSFVATHQTTLIPNARVAEQQHPAVQRQRSSVANIQLQSIFGMGGPEIAIVLVAAAFVLGPSKLAELGKDAGKIAGELKEVPKEFQKGLEEGEAIAKEQIAPADDKKTDD